MPRWRPEQRTLESDPVGLNWEPHAGALWPVANERHELSNYLPLSFKTLKEQEYIEFLSDV